MTGVGELLRYRCKECGAEETYYETEEVPPCFHVKPGQDVGVNRRCPGNRERCGGEFEQVTD